MPVGSISLPTLTNSTLFSECHVSFFTFERGKRERETKRLPFSQLWGDQPFASATVLNSALALQSPALRILELVHFLLLTTQLQLTFFRKLDISGYLFFPSSYKKQCLASVLSSLLLGPCHSLQRRWLPSGPQSY